MRLSALPDAGSFLREAQFDLEQDEAAHSMILGVALDAQREPPPENGFYSGVVRTRSGWLATAAVMTPPHPVILTETESLDALSLIAADLAASGRPVSGVLACPETAETFSDLWRSQTGQNADRAFQMTLYSAEYVKRTSSSPGWLRCAAEEDRDLVAEWIAAFQLEIFHDDISRKVDEIARRRITNSELYLWDDRGARAMAGVTRPTRQGISVNAVYTPPTWRGRGYATTCVSALTEQLLAGGRSFCTLFADLANPASNAIYTKIGYRPLAEFSHFRFDGPVSVDAITSGLSRSSP